MEVLPGGSGSEPLFDSATFSVTAPASVSGSYSALQVGLVMLITGFRPIKAIFRSGRVEFPYVAQSYVVIADLWNEC